MGYFNIEGIPPERIEVTIDQEKNVRIQGESDIIELEPENGVKKCRKEVIDYKFSLPDSADENSIVSEIAKAKDFIRIKWSDKKSDVKEVVQLKVSIPNNNPAPKVQLKRNDS